ncbi:MAG TPA: condensation domain-containing protein, partial [Bryobacteraceae bacterium]|nr:condensation domain-containing protein [Bryobacteraceae bacterium]
ALLAPEREALSYGQLLAQMDRAAAILGAIGIRHGDRVALVVSNGPEAAAAFLSIASVAACAPLNPAYRESEYSFYFSDLAPQAVVIERGIESTGRAVAEQLGLRVIELIPDRGARAGTFSLADEGSCAEHAVCTPQPGDAALVLHTSGTTSRPKQVALAHANLCRSANHIRHVLELTDADRCLNLMPLFHIHGLAAAVLASLTSGASVVCTPGFYAPRILEWIGEFAPTWYTAVPTMHQAILARAGGVPVATSLRFIRSSSAALPPAVMEGLERVFSVPVIEAYGMTEASHQMASNPLPPRRRKPGSVGRAAGPQIAILQDGQPVPPGVTGDIVIRGPNVTSGYVANPEATEASFRDGWFYTGDLGWLDEENYLFISGRSKEMINRGGEKIAPREIDDALLEHPAVAQAMAFSMPDAKLGEEVAAAVVFQPEMQALESELREFVSKRLADFKVPRRIVILDEIPKGPTGKPARLGMAARLGLNGDEEVAPVQAQRREPESDNEKLVAGLWRQVLGREDVGADDNFFDLGGDSMLAALFLSRLAQNGRAVPTLLQLFDKPTVASIAAWLDRNQHRTATLPLNRDSGAPAPLSFAQQRFWFLDRYEEDAAAYVQSTAVRLRGPLDPERLKQAIEQIVARHEILRTTYETRDGAPHAVIGPPREIELRLARLESVEDVHALASAEARRRFDLSRDLMIRPFVARLGPEDHVLLLTRHHIASDGWSAEVLLRELATLYAGGSLAEPQIQYSDFARWQAQRYASGAFDQDLSYWQERLAGCPPLLDLPLDRPRPRKQGFRGARGSFVLAAALVEELSRVARTEGATLFMTLVAAFQALLFRYSDAEDLVVGCPVAGRGRLELEEVIGPAMNTLALRGNLSGDPAFRELLARTRESVLGALPHQELPFDKLVDVLHPVRSLSHSPLFQVLFQLRNLPFTMERFGDLQCEPLEPDTGMAQFDLSLEMTPAGRELRGALIYNTDLFDHETATRFSRHYHNLLEAVARDPELPISRVPILDEDERLCLLSDWNQTEQAMPLERVHAMFEA